MIERPPPITPEEFALCRWDPVRFAWVFLGIRVNPGQETMLRAYIARQGDGWRAFWLWLIVAAGNRAGKTLGLDILIVHSCVYKMALQPPAPGDTAGIKRWAELPYDWWHFAVEQGPAEQVHRDIVRILLGTHEAQQFGCPWSTQMGGADRIATMSDPGTGDESLTWGSKERGEYAWIIFSPQLGGAQIHFRSMKQKALGAVGQNAHGVSADEAGLDPELAAHIKEVFHARRIGTGGQFVAISTPSVATSTDFEDLWDTGDPDNPFRLAHRFSMRMSTRDNIGYGIDEQSFHSLIDGMDEDWIAQNIDGFFMQAQGVWFNSDSVDLMFDETLPEEEAPEAAGIYIHVLDPGLKDKCWSVVFKVTEERELVGVYIDRKLGRQHTREEVRMGKLAHHRYTLGGRAFCETGLDTSGHGGHIFRELFEEDDPPGLKDEDGNTLVPLPGISVKPIEFGGVTSVKRRMLSDLKSAVDEGRIRIPAIGYWLEFRKQYRNYKLADRKIEQDLVMEGAMAVKLLRQAPSHGVDRVAFDWRDGTRPEAEENKDGITPQSVRAVYRRSARRPRVDGGAQGA